MRSEALNFTSTSDVYDQDDFTSSHFRPVYDIVESAEIYLEHIRRTRKLHAILSTLNQWLSDPSKPVHVLDCGVFMGTFTIAAALVARDLGIATNLIACEANPLLEQPIQKNFELYDVNAKLQINGIGSKYGQLEFAYRDGGLIDGTFHHIANKKKGEHGSIICDVIPLNSVIPDTAQVGLVKLDIEGNEPGAFSTISHNENQLRNIFVVEFSPWQQKARLNDHLSYGEFLLTNFAILNAENWASAKPLTRLDTEKALETCLQNQNRHGNTDLIFVPKTLANSTQGEALISQLIEAC